MLFSTIYIENLVSEDKLTHGIFFSFNYVPLNTYNMIINYQKIKLICLELKSVSNTDYDMIKGHTSLKIKHFKLLRHLNNVCVYVTTFENLVLA